MPVRDEVLTNVFPCEAMAATELGRFVLLDDVPGNGETWFLARCFELLRREGLQGVLSFSDPCPRPMVDGGTFFGGHVGTIYQAHNGTYLGRGRARTLRILPDGSTLNDRSIAKLLAQHRGWEHVAARLCRFGADDPTDDVASWGRRWIARLTRPLKHRGNHRYAWGLTSSMRRHVGALREKIETQIKAPLKFPKQVDVLDGLGVAA